MPWYWILIIISAVIGPFEAMHALNKARRKRRERQIPAVPGEVSYIWDLDGTLLDSYGGIVAAARKTAEGAGIQDPEDQILKTVKRESLSAYLRDVSARCGVPFETLLQQYRTYTHLTDDGIVLMDAARATLDRLARSGAAHFVFTHRGASSEPILKRLGILDRFREVVTSEYGFPPKPSGEGIRYLVDKYHLDPEHTWYVGDRAMDVLSAKDAGVKAILLLPADSYVEPVGQEDRIIHSLRDI